MNTQQRPAIDWYIYAYTITNSVIGYVTIFRHLHIQGNRFARWRILYRAPPQPLCRRIEAIVKGRIICGHRQWLIVWKELGWKGKFSTIEGLGR